VYPNPASSCIKIQANNFSNRIILYDLNGNMLLIKYTIKIKLKFRLIFCQVVFMF
jgi:hypothetical protein